MASQSFSMSKLIAVTCLLLSCFVTVGQSVGFCQPYDPAEDGPQNAAGGPTCDLATCLKGRGVEEIVIGLTVREAICPMLADARRKPLDLIPPREVEGPRVIANCEVRDPPASTTYFSENTECTYKSMTNEDFTCQGNVDGFWDTRPECFFTDKTILLNEHKCGYVEFVCTYRRNPNYVPGKECDWEDELGQSGPRFGVECPPVNTTEQPPIVVPPPQQVSFEDQNYILLVVVPIAGIVLLLALVSAIILLARRCCCAKTPQGSGKFGPWPAGGQPWTLGPDNIVADSINKQMDEMFQRTPEAAGLGGGAGGGNPNMPSEIITGAFPNVAAGGGAGGAGGNPNMPAEMMNGDFPNMAGGGGGAGGNPNMPAEMMSGAFPNMAAGGGAGGAGGNPNMPAEMMSGAFPNMAAGGGAGGAGGNPNMPAEMMTGAFPNMAAGGGAGGASGNPNMPAEMMTGAFPNMAAGGGAGGAGGNPNMPSEVMSAEFANMPSGAPGAPSFGSPNQPMDMIDAASFSALASGGSGGAPASTEIDLTMDLYPQEETKLNPIFIDHD